MCESADNVSLIIFIYNIRKFIAVSIIKAVTILSHWALINVPTLLAKMSKLKNRDII
jgi:hypothetical protein